MRLPARQDGVENRDKTIDSGEEKGLVEWQLADTENLFTVLVLVCVPFPVVWSDEGPVFEDEVLPLRRVQSNMSEEDWLHP